MKRILALLLGLALVLGGIPVRAVDQETKETASYLLSSSVLEEAEPEENLSGGIVSEEEAGGMFSVDEDGIQGTWRVLAVPVRFQDEEEFVNDTPAGYGGMTLRELMELSYDGTDRSVGTYYDQVSFGAVSLEAVFLSGGTESVQLSRPRSYYEPMSLDNPGGYLRHVRKVKVYQPDGTYSGTVVYLPELACSRTDSNTDNHVWLERGELAGVCEHMEVRAVRQEDGRILVECRLKEGQQVHSWTDSVCYYAAAHEERLGELTGELYETVRTLAAEQGITDIDCVNFWFSGENGSWSDVLWPCQGYFTGTDASFYRADADRRYIQQFAGALLAEPVSAVTETGEAILLPATGTLTHELGHMLGFPDYYSYYNQNIGTMGTWSLMCIQSMVPQYIHTWAMYTYGKWLDEDNVKEITGEGYYTITTISGATQMEKEGGAMYTWYLDNPASDPDHPEQIVVEFRSARGAFEGSEEVQNYRAADGLILYSVDADAEAALAGNMTATGTDGRFGARLYWTVGAGKKGVLGYDLLSESARTLYDMIFSVLTDRAYPHYEDGAYTTDLGSRSYGSVDPSETENALISRRTGENSGIVINQPTTEPNGVQMTFWVDLDPPEVSAVREDGQAGERTVVLAFDEPVEAGAGLAALVSDTVAAWTEGNRLILTLTGWDQGGELTIPADTVQDSAGRTMEGDYTLTLAPAEGESPAPVTFSDVNRDHWAFEAVSEAAGAGIFQGVSADTFQPQGTLTRAMFVTVLGRLAGAEGIDGDTGFADVEEGSWYAPYVKWASELGIVTGVSEDCFDPQGAITREQMAVMLSRFLEVCEPGVLAQVSGLPFDDQTAVSSWAQEAVRTLASNGLMLGDGDSFDPQGLATRAEAAALVSRCLILVEG